MNLNFFTWNVKNNSDQRFYEDLNLQLIKDEIDILILQECFQDTHISELVNYIEIKDYLNSKGQRWVRVFLKKSSLLNHDGQTSYASNKLRCATIETSDNFKFNLAAIHFYSGAGKTSGQQLFENRELPGHIKDFEIKQKNEHTLIVGDLNYRPFDLELIHPDFFNTTSDKSIIRIFKERRMGSFTYRYFYNPMWNLLGDHNYITRQEKVSGTYYWYADDVGKYNWNLIDGVILSPELMDNVDMESLEIVTELNSKSLIKKSLNDSKESLLVKGYSDHLPVRFSIKTI